MNFGSDYEGLEVLCHYYDIMYYKGLKMEPLKNI